jgi:hypothetical protein
MLSDTLTFWAVALAATMIDPLKWIPAGLVTMFMRTWSMPARMAVTISVALVLSVALFFAITGGVLSSFHLIVGACAAAIWTFFFSLVAKAVGHV